MFPGGGQRVPMLPSKFSLCSLALLQNLTMFPCNVPAYFVFPCSSSFCFVLVFLCRIYSVPLFPPSPGETRPWDRGCPMVNFGIIKSGGKIFPKFSEQFPNGFRCFPKKLNMALALRQLCRLASRQVQRPRTLLPRVSLDFFR